MTPQQFIAKWKAVGLSERSACQQHFLDPRLVPQDEDCEKELKKRTLTNLYNDRPTWLDLAHQKLDEAVFAAYGWDPTMTDDDILAALLELNLQRASSES